MYSLEVYDINMFGHIDHFPEHQKEFIAFQQWILASAIEECQSDKELPRADNILNGLELNLGEILDKYDADALNLINQQAELFYKNIVYRFGCRNVVHHLNTPDTNRGVIIIFKD